MANLVRLVACVAILVGFAGELSLGLLLPSRIKMEYASAQSERLVRVDLPLVGQAAQWCHEAQADNRYGGQFMSCNLLPSR